MNYLPIIEGTNLIDAQKVHNVSLHYDGEKFYYTAVVNGVLVFISYSNDLKNWLQQSGIYVVDMSKFWEMEVPKEVNVIDPINLPVTTLKSKLRF